MYLDIWILVDCEESQAVTLAFRKRGFKAYSCDILPCSGGHPEWHLQMDAITALKSRNWDLVIAHPPCTRIANSGVRWLHERGLWEELDQACEFFNHFIEYGKQGGKIAIENPIPHKYALERIGGGVFSNYTTVPVWAYGKESDLLMALWSPKINTNAKCF